MTTACGSDCYEGESTCYEEVKVTVKKIEG